MDIENVVAVVVMGAQMIIFDDSDEEESDLAPKVFGYAEEIVPRFNDKQFLYHFRITPDTFEDLLQKIHSVSPHEYPHIGHPHMLMEKEIMIMIWCLANMESFRSVADRFGVTKSTCWDVLYRTCKTLLRVNTRYRIIAWPNGHRALQITEGFQRINGFPGIIGAIDGSHIRIKKPKVYPNSYCNRKNYHSVLLQGVCDNRKLFLDVYAGEAGSIHDMRLFKKSDLYRRIGDGNVEFPNDSHMIGDLAYKLSRNLLVGYKNNGVLNVRQKNFNYKLSQCRVVIENAFGYLKGRFRRLKFLETQRGDLIALLIVAGCIMHNICILKGDLAEAIVDNIELEEIVNANIEDEGIDINAELLDVAALNKRTYIMNLLDIDRNIFEEAVG